MPYTATDSHGRKVTVASYEEAGTVAGRWGVIVSSYESEGPYLHDVRSSVLTPDEAERIAAKLLHSAGVARYMAGAGPRPTTGPRGVEKLSAVLAERLREVT